MTTTSWTGAPQTIAPGGVTLAMAQTTNGTMVLSTLNQATTNNDGTLQYASGGSPPTNLDVPALMKQPTIVCANWGGNNLSVVNRSIAQATPIWVMAVGPGFPWNPTSPLASSPTISVNQFAQGITSPQWQTLRLQANADTNAVIALIGGPVSSAGINAYVISLNSPSGDTGQPSGKPAQPPAATSGFYATAGGNTFDFLFNWQSSYTLFVANMSAVSASPVTLTLF